MASRRGVLFGIGGGAALVLAGGTWRVLRQPRTAIASWRTLAEPVDDVRLDAFRYAILAPNPHNRQPWMIRLEGPDGAVLSCDPDKRLPETDPFDRQTVIGFGTFIELARIAASHRGYRLDVDGFPHGEPQPRLNGEPIARLRFVRDPAIAPDPLRSAIGVRHTSREVFTGPLSATQIAALAAEGARVSADAALLAPLRAITVAAITRELTLPRTWMESVRLLRIGAAEIDAHPDGLALSGPMIEATALARLITRAELADPASQAFRIGLEQQRRIAGSVPAALWIASPDNSRAAQLVAGYAYARTALTAATLSLSIQPLSQALQEYHEMTGLYARVHRLLGATGPQRVQMLARVGLGPPVGPAARYPLTAHLLP